MAVVAMAHEARDFVQCLGNDARTPANLRTLAGTLHLEFPPRPLDGGVLPPGHAHFGEAAHFLLRAAKLIRDAAAHSPPVPLLVSLTPDHRARLQSLCACALSSWQTREWPQLDVNATVVNQPAVARVQKVGTAVSLQALYHAGDEAAGPIYASTLSTSYVMEQLVQRGHRARQQGARATHADRTVAEDLEEFRLLGEEGAAALDVPVFLGQVASGNRLMFPTKLVEQLRPGEVKTALDAWYNAHVAAARKILSAAGEDPDALLPETVACLIGGDFWQIWHFDATQGQLVFQPTPGYATHVRGSLDELQLSAADNLHAISTAAGEGATRPDSTAVPALYTHCFLAAGHALVTSGSAARAVRRAAGPLGPAGLAEGDPVHSILNRRVPGGMGILLDAFCVHAGAQSGAPTFATVAEAIAEQQAFIQAGLAGVRSAALRALVDPILRANAGVLLQRQTMFAAVRHPSPTLWDPSLTSLMGGNYKTDEQYKPEVFYHGVRCFRRSVVELLQQRDDGHEHVEDFYPDVDVRKAIRALFELVPQRAVSSLADLDGLQHEARAVVAALLFHWQGSPSTPLVELGLSIISERAALRAAAGQLVTRPARPAGRARIR